MAITYVPPKNNKAKNIKLDDVDNNFQSNDVEGALKELIENGGSGSGHIHGNKTTLDKITEEKLTSWDNKLDSIPSEYVTESELTEKNYATNSQLGNKVDKVEGKGLSTNDYTTVEKEKLEGLSNYTLPKASASELGGIKVGTGLDVTSDGVLNATGVSVDLTPYQQKTDSALTTTSKEIVGAINEIENKVGDETTGLIKDVNDLKNNNGEKVQSDWSISDTNSDAYIKNKPTKLSQFTNDLNLGGEGSSNTKSIYYNVKDFGATGDGNTDDTIAIQTVLDKATTEGSVKIFIPNGIYKIKRLRLHKNTEIQMDFNATLLRNRDVATTETCPLFLNGQKGNNSYATGWDGDGNIKIQGGTINGNWIAGDSSGVAYGQTFAFGHAQNIQLLDIKFIDGANGDHVIDFSGCKDIYIDRCEFLGTHGTGRITEVIQLDYISTGSFPHFGSNDSTPTENVLIQNCLFSPNYDNTDSICNISIGSHSAQHPYPSKNITFRKNTIVDSYAESIKIVHSVNVDIYNNNIYYTKKNNCTNVILITTESSTNEYFEKSDYINIEKNIIHDLDSSSLNSIIIVTSPSDDTNEQSVAVNIRNNIFKNISTTKNISSYRDRIKCISYSDIFNSVIEGNVFENIPNCTCIDMSNCKNLNICKNYAYNVSNLISQFNIGTSSSCLTIDSNRAYNISDCMFGFYDNYANRINSYFTISNSVTDSEKIMNLNKCSNFSIINNLCANSIIEMEGCDGFKIHNNILKTMSSEYVNEFNPLKNMNISYNTFTYIHDIKHYIDSMFSNNIIKNNTNSFDVVGANNFKICDNTIMYDLKGSNLTSAVYANRSDVTKLFYLNNNTFKSNNDYTFKYIVEVQNGTLAYCFNNDLPSTVGTAYYVNSKDGFITYNGNNKYLLFVNSDGSVSSELI